VKSGLGSSLQQTLGSANSDLFAARIVMALKCFVPISRLFRLHDQVLSCQKGAVRWLA